MKFCLLAEALMSYLELFISFSKTAVVFILLHCCWWSRAELTNHIYSRCCFAFLIILSPQQSCFRDDCILGKHNHLLHQLKKENRVWFAGDHFNKLNPEILSRKIYFLFFFNPLMIWSAETTAFQIMSKSYTNFCYEIC